MEVHAQAKTTQIAIPALNTAEAASLTLSGGSATSAAAPAASTAAAAAAAGMALGTKIAIGAIVLALLGGGGLAAAKLLSSGTRSQVAWF